MSINTGHRILAVADTYLRADLMRRLLAEAGLLARVVEVGSARPAMPGLREYQGDPMDLDALLDGEQILIVHAAAITAELLSRHPSIRVVACLRGAPVNIDIAGAAARGVVVLRTPAKNAGPVADLTMWFVQALLRGSISAATWLQSVANDPQFVPDVAFLGGAWMAREPSEASIGLIGLGAVGRRVAALATTAGMRVSAHDPFAIGTPEGPPLLPLDVVLAQSDVVSLHAPATASTRHLINERELSLMRPGSFLINTARESLVNEAALVEALRSGRLAGAALDVFEPDGRWRELSSMPSVLLTPHTGGATIGTQRRAVAMIAEDLQRFQHGLPLLHAAEAAH